MIVMGDQLLPFSQLISRSCDQNLVPLFGKKSELLFSGGVYNIWDFLQNASIATQMLEIEVAC